MKINIDRKYSRKIILLGIQAFINELIYRKKKGDKRYTKFDSDNDIFLGTIGEYVFAKYLFDKGFEKDKDYARVSDNGPLINEKDFTNINDLKLDKYDFKLNLFFDKNGNPLENLKIDVKTQKYVGRYNKNWQFAVNKQTVEKIKNGHSKIDRFVFIFSQKGIHDFIDIRLENMSIAELERLNVNEIKLKEKVLTLDIVGTIGSVDFVNNSKFFKKEEIFRINKTKNGYISHPVEADMHRISIYKLENINKVFPSRNINIQAQKTLDIANLFSPSDRFVKIKASDGQEILFPYSKTYTNSQFEDFESLIRGLS